MSFFDNFLNVKELFTSLKNPETLKQIPKTFIRKDLLFAAGIAIIILILILPMPTWLLDISLTISITFSVLILMTVIFIERPIDFSVFPTILLVSTMLRLSLNLASTRLILAHGHEGLSAAGQLIKAFGMLIMGGNFVIGIIVFAILIIVNFVVITKGSGRIAEVSARFTLDSMPGKQMAIDADLSAGLIDEATAKQRRRELEIETNFFGAMDGAAKFVRGDAIAGLLITFINIIAGMIIGIVQQGISFQEASTTYTLLTVGDGLVSQVPSLIVSTASGMLVSKAGSDVSTDKALFSQLGSYPSAIGMSAFLMLCFTLLPEIPKLPFLLISAILGYLAFVITKCEEKAIEQAQKQEQEIQKSDEEEIADNLKMENIKIELGIGLLSLMKEDSPINIISKIKILRKEMALNMGFIIPQVRIKDNFQNDNNQFSIKIKDLLVIKGNVYPNKYMIVNGSHDVDIEGINDKDPYFNIDVVWVDETKKDDAEESGYHLIDPASVIITSLSQVLQTHIHEIFSYSDTTVLLDQMDDAHQKLLKDIVPSQISVTLIQRVLQDLLSEGVAIKDLGTIIEGIAEISAYVKSPNQIIEHVRTKLKRQITSSVIADDGAMHIIAIDPVVEQNFINSLIGDNDNKQIGVPPTELQQFIFNLSNAYSKSLNEQGNAAIVVSDVLRRPIRTLTERAIPEAKVLSQNEISPRTKLVIDAQINIAEA